MLRIVKRKGSKYLYIRGAVRGRRVYESAQTAERSQAEALRAKREAELYEESVFGARAVVSFRQAVIAFLDYEERGKRTADYIGRLLSHFDATPLVKIDQHAADVAVKAILRPEAKPATKIRTVYTPLTSILNFSARRGWCDVPKFEKPTPPSGKTRWLTPSEATRLVDGAAPHLRPLLTFLLCTGARLSEALDLDWDDVDLPAARVRFRNTKNGTDRIANLPPRAIVAMANIEGEHVERVFRRDDGAAYKDRERLEGGQIKTAFRTACRNAGLMKVVRLGDGRGDGPCSLVSIKPSVTPHDMRHTWASYFYAVSKDLLLLKDEGGWRTTSMCERYCHLAPSGIAAEVHLIWGASHPRIGALPGTEASKNLRDEIGAVHA